MSGVYFFTHLWQVVDKIHEIVITPEVGMVFQSADDAYDMCNTHASKFGSSIRKSTTKYKSDKSLFKKYIVCSSKETDKLIHQRTQQG
jgi:hypothetical protein